MSEENLRKLLEILTRLRESESVVNVRGGRGRGATHPYKPRDVSPGYGIINPIKKPKPNEYFQRVEVSRAFKNKEQENKDEE